MGGGGSSLAHGEYLQWEFTIVLIYAPHLHKGNVKSCDQYDYGLHNQGGCETES